MANKQVDSATPKTPPAVPCRDCDLRACDPAPKFNLGQTIRYGPHEVVVVGVVVGFDGGPRGPKVYRYMVQSGRVPPPFPIANAQWVGEYALRAVAPDPPPRSGSE